MGLHIRFNDRWKSVVALRIRDSLRQVGAVKAIGMNTALRVAEIESSRESEDVGPEGQPVHQVSRTFNDKHAPGLSREIEAKLAVVEAKSWVGGANHECRVSFPNRVVACVRHIHVAPAVHRHTGGPETDTSNYSAKRT